jgi:phosphomannomutase
MVPTTADFSDRKCKSYIPNYSNFLKKTVRHLVRQSMTINDPMNNIDDTDMSTIDKNSSQLQYPLTGLKICVNAGNGAGGFLAQTLSELGADTSSSIHLNPDGSFPNHIANPEDKKAIQCTLDAVIKGNADLGVCLDTDADRVGLVEGISDCNPSGITDHVISNGRLLNRNNLIALVSKVALRGVSPGKVGVVVTDSATSNGLTRFIEGTLKGKHVRFKKGYRYVIEKGRSIEGCVVAVECSGHIYIYMYIYIYTYIYIYIYIYVYI